MKQKTKMMTQDGKKQETNGYITNSQCNQLPVGLIAQLVESQRSWVWIPFKPLFFSEWYCLISVCNAISVVSFCRDMIGSWSHSCYFRCYHSCCNLVVVFFSRMTHSLQCETQQKLARDAYIENEDTFEIFDPRNPINKRRREASKKAMKDKRKWYQGRAGRFVSKAVQGTSAVFRKSSWKHPKSCRAL